MQNHRYGIHTIQLYYALTSKQAYTVHRKFRNGAKGQYRYYKDDDYKSKKGVERWICERFKEQGVIVYLLMQKESQNKTDQQVPCGIMLRVNPVALTCGRRDPSQVFQAMKLELRSLDKRMDDILSDCGLKITFDQLSISRIDCCLDLFFLSQEDVLSYLRILQKSPLPQHYRMDSYPKSAKNYKEKNRHSCRMKCKEVTLTVYDKVFQLNEEKLLHEVEELPDTMLRIEVSRKSSNYRRALSCDEKSSNAAILAAMYTHASDVIHRYLKRVHTGDRYAKFENAKACIEAKYTKKKRKHMLQLLNASSDNKFYDSAKKHSSLTTSQLNAARKNFEKLGISFITLPNTSACELLCALDRQITNDGFVNLIARQ